MSFNQGSSSGTLSFRPAKFDIDWDGVSDAKASFQLACPDTAASYSAKAYAIFTESGEVGCNNGQSLSAWSIGERYFTVAGNCARTYATDIALSATVSSGIATIVFSGVSPTTSTYAWQLTATKGTAATRVVIAGKISPVGLNPYAQQGGGRISLVSGSTASGCF